MVSLARRGDSQCACRAVIDLAPALDIVLGGTAERAVAYALTVGPLVDYRIPD